MQHYAPLCIVLLCLVWQNVESITVSSRGEPPIAATSQNFTVALQLLERMFQSQQRQRRLIPYYSYYVLNNNNNHNSYNQPRPVPTPFPVQNTALDLLVKSLYSPHQLNPTYPPLQHQQQQHQQQQQQHQQQQQQQQQLQPTFRPIIPQHQLYQHNKQQLYQPRPQQSFQPKYQQLPHIRPSYADLLPYLVRAKPTAPPNFIPVDTPSISPLRSKSYTDLLKILAQNKLLAATVTKAPVLKPVAPIEPIAPVEPAPSFPRLLSPLASVTRFPGPPASKAGKNAPGRPGLDYPTYHKIPPTSFSCASQRYKGFFADPDTSCQVWHYCDLNGGQASFLCPNGTIFSQVLLTCDWWFNVKCTNTLQAYVLNERLYKFIMPKRPSFPEDFSGPQVNDYLIEKQVELQEKEQAKIERLKKKYKAHEFEDVDALQELLDKMRNGNFEEPEEKPDKNIDDDIKEEEVK